MRLPLLLLIVGISVAAGPATRPVASDADRPTGWTFDHGGVVRGDASRKRIALIFTGGDFGEGTEPVLDALKAQGVRASLFVTGGFLRKPGQAAWVRRAVAEGHYVGPHSDQHPLYCPWDRREQSLVTEEQFRADLQKNIDDLRALGALKDRDKPVYFIPPYEWFNADQVKWAKGMNVVLFNFTLGSGSNRDYIPESEKKFAPSEKIIEDILAHERKDPHGLNGFLLLMHLGAQRKDKVFRHVGPLIIELKRRGYEFVRIDEMLGAAR
jgi:peptidoglycan/xylan/chitin deacetylase (PgdA/CDA1 family)